MPGLETETLVRAGSFLFFFVALAAAVVLVPRRRLTVSKARRWGANLAIVALNPLSVFLVFPVLPVGMALLASEQNWGLLNQLNMPY